MGSPSNWADLPIDLLVSVAKLLPVVDYIRFAAVCTSWASAASMPGDSLNPPPTLEKKPYLLLPGEDGEQSESCMLQDISDNSCYRIDPLPEIRGKWCIGSQFGWLATLDEFSNPGLLNPLTRAQIHLPPISTIADNTVDPVYDDDGSSVISGYRYIQRTPMYSLQATSHSLKEFRCDVSITKLVTSSSPADGNFSAMAIFGKTRSLIFTRQPGEKGWAFVDYPIDIHDIIYYDGKFFAVTESGGVWAIDLHAYRDQVRPKLVASGHKTHTCSGWYLVVEYSSGVLLQVCRDVGLFGDENHRYRSYQTNYVEVKRLDPKSSPSWTPVTDLGDCSIILGTCHSMSLLNPEIYGLKKNCVYFTDDLVWRWLLARWPKQGTSTDIGVFDIHHQTYAAIHTPHLLLKWPPPIWIIPSSL